MRHHPHALMIFAAGFGTRMGVLTADRPKPLIEVAGKPLIDHALGYARGVTADPIVANAHYRAGQLRDHLDGTGVLISHEESDILDTGGGLRQALPLLGPGPVFTFNADAVFAGPNPLSHLAHAWDPDRMDGLLLLVPPARAHGHTLKSGFRMNREGRLARAPELAYTGAQIVGTDRLADIPDRVFSLNLLWDRMVADGRLFGVVYPGHWCDVGHPDGIALAEEMMSNRHV